MARTTAYLRETSDEELRARARERIARTARSGSPPRELYSPEDLDWAFEGHEAELQELEQEAAEVPAAEAQHQGAVQRRRELQRMTNRVLAEWDEQRRREAEAEARKRLGWKKGERP
jgi:hypothetical protein